MSKIRKPVEGQRVYVVDHWTETVRMGEVVSVLSDQFTYRDDDDGQIYFCKFNGGWLSDEPS